jgi:hypothetical protein
MAWTLLVHADASVLPPGNLKKDATMLPSHGCPRGHRPTVHPSVHYRPRDNRDPLPPVWPPPFPVWPPHPSRPPHPPPHPFSPHVWPPPDCQAHLVPIRSMGGWIYIDFIYFQMSTHVGNLLYSLIIFVSIIKGKFLIMVVDTSFRIFMYSLPLSMK